MKVLAIFNGKGGCGKTNLAVHVGVVAAHTARTAIIDLDVEMQDAYTWSIARQHHAPSVLRSTPAQLSVDLAELANNGVEVAILDFPPTLSPGNSIALALADLIVIPVQPTSSDLNGFHKAVKIIRSSKTPFVFVISRANANDSDVCDTTSVLARYGDVCPTHLGDRIAFKRSVSVGKSAIEFERKSKAAAESIEVCRWVMQKCGGSH